MSVKRCTVRVLGQYQHFYSFAALTRSISDTSATRAQIPYASTFHEVFSTYVQIYNLYLPHRKLYIRNFQPIYNTVQHIFRDTTYILVFNTFATLGVPYTVKGHKFRRWKTNAGNTPGKTKRFFVLKAFCAYR